jgi:hypothetical protein
VKGSGRQPTRKQLKVAVALAKGKSLKQAAIEAGLSPSRQAGYQAIEAMKNSNRGAQIMEDLGLGARVIIDKHLRPLLTARMTKHYVIEGELVARTYDDNTTRFKAVNLSAEILGIKLAEQENDAPSIRAVVMNFSHRPPQPPPKFEPPDIITPAP